MSPATLLALIVATEPSPTSVIPPGSPTAELVAVSLAGIAAIITALATFTNLRRRRQAEADAIPLPAAADPEDRVSRLRERITAMETQLDDLREHKLPDRTTLAEARLTDASRRLSDLEERMDLRRAADVVIESETAPRRRRKRPEDGVP